MHIYPSTIHYLTQPPLALLLIILQHVGIPTVSDLRVHYRLIEFGIVVQYIQGPLPVSLLYHIRRLTQQVN
jgi:hypothetical protein